METGLLCQKWNVILSIQAITAHPNNAPSNVGLLALKRLHCDEYRCEVFKSSVCIQCPKHCKGQKKFFGHALANKRKGKDGQLGYFPMLSSYVNTSHLESFAKNCVEHAFNKSTQELLPEFECTDQGRARATYYMVSF